MQSGMDLTPIFDPYLTPISDISETFSEDFLTIVRAGFKDLVSGVIP